MMANRVAVPREVLEGLYDRASSMNRPQPALTVSDAERLAKAGIKVDLENVCLQPDEAKPYFPENRMLMDPLIHRMRLAFPISPIKYDSPRFRYMAAEYCSYKDGSPTKVALFVVTVHGNAQIIEDDIKSWPSDALFAALHLLIETEPKDKTVELLRQGQKDASRYFSGAVGGALPNAFYNGQGT